MLPKVLIVEDDKHISGLISDYCKASGYKPIIASRGDFALRLFESEQPDIVLLDIMLPVMDGFEICRMLRKTSSVPIIMISSKKDDEDKILVLNLGADDYIEKPFSPRVLMAKISALLRRSNELSQNLNPTEIEFKNLILNNSSRTLTKDGEDIPLSKTEFDVLYLLLTHSNQVLTREKIFDNVWGVDEYGDLSTVTVHINKLRNKIEDNPSKPRIINTIRGVGYVIK